MLDQLEMAIRQYEQIAPNPGRDMAPAQADQISEWLEQQVCGITQSLLTRPGFRRASRWPIDHLADQAQCPERKAVTAVDESLVRLARELSSFAQIGSISRQLQRLGPNGEQVPVGDPRAFDQPPGDSSLSPMPLGLHDVEFIATRPWHDLVSARDYFRPTAQFNFPSSEYEQWANFIPAFVPKLSVPGDYITRCMEIRVDHWRDVLHRFYIRCDRAQQLADDDLNSDWSKVGDSFAQLSVSTEDLHQLTRHSKDARVRDSCIALVQTLAAYHAGTDLSWLGQIAGLSTGDSLIPHSVIPEHRWDVPERAAKALVDIVDIVRHQPPEELIEELKVTRRLVLIEERREGFLDGDPIVAHDASAAWHGRDNLSWELLWTAADRARVGRNVGPDDLSNPKASEAREPPSPQAVKDRRGRLKALLTEEANNLIRSKGGSEYGLALGREEICLLGWFSEERLEVLPHTPPRH